MRHAPRLKTTTKKCLYQKPLPKTREEEKAEPPLLLLLLLLLKRRPPQ